MMTRLTDRSPARRSQRAAAVEAIVALAAAGSVVLLARSLSFDDPPALDVELRRRARGRVGPRIARAMAPLFPLGLPGGYLTVAYIAAHRLHHAGRRGGPEIVMASWLGWLVHRGFKLFYIRQRPLAPGRRYRIDSFPSGHTTGATALATSMALVLRRERLVSRSAAAAIGLAAPLVMGSYRVLADDHWATDVAGGWLLGGAIGLACDAALADFVGGAGDDVMERERKRRRRRRPGRRG